MQRLNYHHLHYFWVVARQGKLTQAAELLNISQSALSMQIRQLEEELGKDLFVRKGRSLELTEVGRITLSYADQIFRQGEELQALLGHGLRPTREMIRIGSVATLSRNFQEAFVAPVIDRTDVHLVMQSGRLEDMLSRLASHALDILLSNVQVPGDEERPFRTRLLARQAVGVIGKRTDRGGRFRLPDDLRDRPVLLPGQYSEIRSGFELLCEEWGVQPEILAEVDDMAMLRLLARDSDAFAILPKVVVRDEISSGELFEYATLPGLHENFYAISVRRHYQSSLMKELLARPSDDFFNPVE